MEKHPALEEIALWVLDRKSVREPTRTHMEAACDSCSRLAASLLELVEDARSAVRSEPSPNMMARARELIQRMHEETTFLLARLVQDTFSLGGMRDEAGEARYLLFDAGDYELDLRVRPVREGKRAEVRGQLHGPEGAELQEFEVRLARGDDLLQSGSTDDLGEFLLEGAPLPPFHLEFLRGSLRIQTPEITR